MGKYFGTDGFRGEAGITLTADHAYKVGRFLGWYYNALRERNGDTNPARIVIGKDTRRSSYMFEYSLVAGLTASGADAYILVYNLNRSKEFDRYAVELSRRTGLKLVRFCTRYDQFYRPGKSMLVPEVFDFISLIDNAKYVLTDSFHATAFSLNLHTEPICVYPKEFGGRLESILQQTNQTQRHIADYSDFDVVNRPVDFDYVDRILERERKKANEFLEEVVKEAARS